MQRFIGIAILGLVTSAAAQAPPQFPASVNVGPYIHVKTNMAAAQSQYDHTFKETGNAALALQLANLQIDSDSKARIGAALDRVRKENPKLFERIAADYGISVEELR